MREKWARRIAYFTGAIVLMLALMFARIQNPLITPTDETGPALNRSAEQDIEQIEKKSVSRDRIEHGLHIYNQQACSMCHSIAGHGNPRNPLDGIAEKYSARELVYWVTGDKAIQHALPERYINIKQQFTKLTDYELESLIFYLQSLKKDTGSGMLESTNE